ncbi:hypothetical protein BGZ58_010983 [Dissophora ornata]|nr:hypothetical protein BGZ58_010983 [Dissophora ornata]
MLKPAHLAHSRNHSYESNTPPPYMKSPDDVYLAQDNDVATGRTMGKEVDLDLDLEQDYEDDLLAQVHHISDPDVLRQLLIQKEQERQGLAENLDLAARLGLDLHQQMQRLDLESSMKLQSLHDENVALQSKVHLSHELSYQLAHSEHEVKELTGHNRFLQKELDTCRQELKAFRKELDELSEHMAEISAEMFDAKSKVNSYARRLGEVEQELASTQELNVNLQIQLDNTLQKQKQTHSNTTQAVKLIQSDLGKVFSESDTMRLTLEELETRQMKCEGKVIEMMTNTREYAQLLEEAQETIHTLRIESDMEGRGWSSRGPHAAIWDNKTGDHPEQHLHEIEHSRTTTALRLPSNITDSNDPNNHQEPNADEGLDPMFDATSWNIGGANSLGMELGLGSLASELAGAPRGLDQELAGFSRGMDQGLAGYEHAASTLDQELADDNRTFSLQNNNQSSLASELEAIENRSFSSTNDAQDHHEVSTFVTDGTPRGSLDEYQGDTPSTPVLSQRFSLSAELHQRLEANNILQNVLSGAMKPVWTSTSTVGITGVLGPVHHSPSSNRDISKTLSMMTLPNQRTSASISTMLSPKPSPLVPRTSTAAAAETGANKSTSLSSSGTGFTASGPYSASLSGVGADIASTSFSSAMSSPGTTRASATDPHNSLKYLLLATSRADLSKVITDSNAKTPASKGLGGSSSSSSSSTTTTFSASGKNTRATGKSVTNSSSNGSIGRDSKVRASLPPSSASASSKKTIISSNGRPTPPRSIPIPGGGARSGSGRKSTSPASSWSSSATMQPLTSMSRRPSLPGASPSSSTPSTPSGTSSSRSRPPWN